MDNLKRTAVMTPKIDANKSRDSKSPKKQVKAVQPPPETQASHTIVVGIGASAGGLEALKNVLPGLPSEANMSFVIVQHLDPKHRSMLPSLLDRHTKMAVVEIKDKMEVTPNTVHITPAGREVKIEGNCLRLTEPRTEIGPKPSVDYFLTSLAESKGDRAVGIILSGTGSDGAHGIRAIKAGGGITIVQKEDTAKYNGMPHAAIETGHVDLVVAPEDIGKELQVALKYPNLVPKVLPEAQVPRDLNKILLMIAERTRVSFSEYKMATINRRVARRMALHKNATLNDYVNYMERFPDEIDLLFKDILISVTGFFRDPEAFNALKRILPHLVANKEPGDNIRIWVPGCATGEEAYTVAMLLHESLRESINQYNLQIFGTDLDQDAIVRARRGIYPAATVTDLDKQLLEKYFVHEDSTLQVKKAIREMIVFAKQDLTCDPPFSHLDLISCRNLLIYFNAALQKKIVPMFHYVLNPGGILLLGKSESIGQFADLFDPVVKKWKIYRRRDVIRAPMVQFGAGTRRRYTGAPMARQPLREKEVSVRQILADSVISATGSRAVLIDDRQEIVYVHGDVSPFLVLGPGKPGLNILNMAVPRLRLDLRSVIHKASRENRFVRSNHIRMEINGKTSTMIIEAGPASHPEGTPDLLLILFHESAVEVCASEADLAERQSLDPRIMELEQELAATREHLQTTVEELETTNEELQSANEELQSANEELQSSNEELETSNEELQSTNEELTTVNEELQVKTNELAAANTDLENILKRSGTAMVIVDKNLKLTQFTPGATYFFQISSSDRGQVITTVPTSITLPGLRDLLDRVIEKGDAHEQELFCDDKVFFMRIAPYLSETGQPAGAMIIFVDQSEIRASENELHKSNLFLQAILDNLLDGIILIHETGVIETCNPAVEKIFGYRVAELVGQNVSVLQPEPHRSRHDQYMRHYFETGKSKIIGIGRNVTGLRKNGETVPVHLAVTELWIAEERKFVGIVRSLSD